MTGDGRWTVRPMTAPGGPGAPHVEIGIGRPLWIGREGDVVIGREPADRGVSRRALRVEPAADGWRLEIANGNGGTVHPLGLAPLAGPHVRLAWPRIAVRLHGAEPGSAHWVLLESATYPYPDPGERLPAADRTTDLAAFPLPLTDTQERVLRTVFEPVLAWPPSLEPPLQLKRAARILGVSDSAIQKSLTQARAKALLLGLPRTVELIQPDYLYVLVANGYLRPADG